jgi:multiple sugar transport system ATP-binding protein
VERAAKVLDLDELLKRKPKALSGGQRQRVAIGRAIVRHPKIFLFDEPLSNLDAKLRVQMRTEISKLHQRLGVTMIYVTHDQIEAMTMGDRIVVLQDGFIQQIDTPMNLYDSPSNKFVAGFIGSPAMNFINGRISNHNDLHFMSNDGKIKFPVSVSNISAIKNYVDKEITIGVRPENINLRPVTPSAEPYSSIIMVDVVEPMGNESFVYFEINDEQMVSRQKIVEKISHGTEMRMILDLNKIHFFDSESGLTIR